LECLCQEKKQNEEDAIDTFLVQAFSKIDLLLQALRSELGITRAIERRFSKIDDEALSLEDATLQSLFRIIIKYAIQELYLDEEKRKSDAGSATRQLYDFELKAKEEVYCRNEKSILSYFLL